jgi:hypothetical protein
MSLTPTNAGVAGLFWEGMQTLSYLHQMTYFLLPRHRVLFCGSQQDNKP